jgi:hypothetical protein
MCLVRTLCPKPAHMASLAVWLSNRMSVSHRRCRECGTYFIVMLDKRVGVKAFVARCALETELVVDLSPRADDLRRVEHQSTARWVRCQMRLTCSAAYTVLSHRGHFVGAPNGFISQD